MANKHKKQIKSSEVASITPRRGVRVQRPKVNRKSTSTRRVRETDSAYFLKLVMYFVFGTFWVHIAHSDWVVPLPIGLIIGLAFASHEHFQIDRKIEYAVLMVAMFLSYFITPKFILQF